MAITTKRLLDYSWMSQASYLDFSGLSNSTSATIIQGRLTDSSINAANNFATEQARNFLGLNTVDSADGYAFINQRPNTSSGFSATVFSSNAGAGYTIAVRGTEPGNDFISDLLSADGLGVVLTGKAIEQLIDAYRYYKQLTSVGTSNIYSEAEITKLVQLYVQTPAAIFAGPGLEGQILSFESALRQDTGLHLIPSGTPINFTGHSLGGHVAALLTEMVAQFDGIGRVGDVVTYNAPGFDALTYEVQNWLGFNTSVQTGILGTKHLAITGEGGLEVTSGLGQVNGTKQFTFIEKATLGISLDNHSIVKLGDSFAVKAVLSQLDPNQNAAQLDSMLKAASNQPSNSLERTLDVLGKIFGDNFTTATDDRNALYANLAALQQSTLFKQAAGQLNIRDLSTFSAAQIISNAQETTPEGLAYRYALIELNPFALTGADYSTHNSNGELDRYDPATGTGQLTDLYLKDRAAMLSWKMRYDVGAKDADDHFFYGDRTDKPYSEEWDSSTIIGNFDFVDHGIVIDGTPLTLAIDGAGITQYDHQIVFGSNNADTLLGSGDTDHLYGMAGDDTLNGMGGNDYVEGGAGDDTLEGGLGNDMLLGGQGNDTYLYTNGGTNQDGFDTLLDSDGQGSIVVDGNTLAGGDIYGDTRVHRDADKHLYVDVRPGRLVIDGNLMVQNYQTGNLGISLSTNPVAEPVADTAIIYGDLAAQDQDPVSVGVQTATDSRGNIITDPNTPEVGRTDLLHGSIVNDIIVGLGGSDILDGKAGNDRLYANTQISVADAIAQGNTQTGTGQRGDWLNGGNGEDTLIGGADNDVLIGGADADLLIGGAGDDDILGAADAVADSFDWTVTDQAGARLFQPTSGTVNAVDSIGDVVYAGAGNDYVYSGDGNDVIFGENGNDRLDGNGGNDIILGGDGEDQLFGGDGVDYLDGGKNDDQIQGGLGNDILIGGLGNDILDGGAGQDLYLFNKGDGEDTILETTTSNTLRFGSGINSSDITLRLGSLLLDLGNGDAVHIGNFDQNDVFNSASISSFEFADGATLTTTELLARGFDLEGTVGDDTLIGTNTTDRISGLAGDDQLQGGDGNDMLDGGDGNDTLYGQDSNDILDGGAGDDTLIGGLGSDTISGGAGDDLIAGDNGGADTSGDADSIDGGDGNDQIDGQGGDDSINGGDGGDLIAGGLGNDIVNGGTGDDALYGEEGNDTLLGGAGDDSLNGGLGDDTLTGGQGNDTYIFNRGDGQDLILENGNSDAIDILQFGANIRPSNVTISRVGSNDLLFSINDSTDQITVQGYYTDVANRIEQVRFSDGSLLTSADFNDLPINGTAGDDTITGTHFAEHINGLAGNDVIDGADGDDTLDGGVGDDSLNGGTGDDTLNGGEGNDTLIGGDGQDTYLFGYGAGADTLIDMESGGIIRLEAGVAFSDLIFAQQGDDLLLKINGTNDSARLQGYYTHPQAAWTVQDGSGTTTTPQAIMDTLAQQSEITQLENAFITQAKAGIVNSYLAQGYATQADGTASLQFLSGGGGNGGELFAYDTVTTVTSTRTQYYQSGSITNVVVLPPTFSSSELWDAVYSRYESTVVHNTVAVNIVDTASDAAVIYAVPTYSVSSNSSVQFLRVSWTSTQDQTSTSTSFSSGLYIFDQGYSSNQYATNLGALIGYEVIGTVRTDTRYRVSGTGTQILASPGNLRTAGALPQAVAVQYHQNQQQFKIQKITLGDAGQTVYANELTVVNGGFGIDVIVNAGFAFGGAGDDTFVGGNQLYGGDGNDTLLNGVTLNGGAGNDYMEGGSGATTYLIEPAQTGNDLTVDNGDSEQAYADWYYRSRGVQDAQQSGQYGNKWVLFYPEGEAFDSYDEVVAYLGDRYDPVELIASGNLYFVPPLPEFIRPDANDYAALQGAYDAGVIEKDTVEFGAGIALSDLSLSLGREENRTILKLSWANGASQARLHIPTATDLIGTGVEQVKFADGAVVSVRDIIALIPLINFTVPANAFNDVDFILDSVLMYSATLADGSTLPSWLNFDGATGTFRGTPVDANLGNLNIIITATDTDGLSEATHIALNIDSILTGYNITTDDGNGNSTAAYFDAYGIRLSDNYAHADGSYGNNIFNADGSSFGESYDADGVLVTNSESYTNTDGSYSSDTYYADGSSSGIYRNPDGSYYTYTDDGQGNYTELDYAADDTQTGDYYDHADGSYGYNYFNVDGSSSGEVHNQDGSYFTYTDDGQGHYSKLDYAADGTLISNHAPTIMNALTDQIIFQDQLFAFSVLANTFDDADFIHGDALTYSATLNDGTALPTWLTFDATTQVFSGTPLNEDAGSLNVQVTATDTGGLSVSSVFALNVLNINDAPTANADVAVAQADGGIVTLTAATLLANDTDPDTIHGDLLNIVGVSQAASGAVVTLLNGDVQYDIGNLYQSLGAGQTATDTFSYTIADAAGVESAAIVTATINGVNDAPVVATTLTAQNTTQGQAFSFAVPTDTFSDVDTADQLTLSAQLANGAALPSWLTFNSASRSFSGTAGIGDAANLDIIVTATDTGGLSANSHLSLTVNAPVINGTSRSDTLIGTQYDDTLIGLAGKDLLDGGSGTDTLIGGLGSDTYVVDNAGDVVIENASEGNDTVQSSVTYTLSDNVENLTLTGTVAINGTGNNLSNELIGNSANNVLTGGISKDLLDGGSGIDTLIGGLGSDTYVVDNAGDVVIENASEGNDTVQSSVTYTLSDNVENLTLTGTVAINGTGNNLSNVLLGNSAINTLTGGAGSDLINGGAGNDILNGEAGNDILEGADGDDTLTGTGGKNLFNGGAGTDSLTGKGGNELFIGGAGNDTITTGAGADIIVFNRGDGQDTVAVSTGADNTLSLGGGINYQNLTLSKSGSSLIFGAGSATGSGQADQITLQNWYNNTNNHSIAKLQVVLDANTYNASSSDVLLNHQVQSFDFALLVQNFDQARAANPDLSAWSVTDALLSAHLASSDSAALGGDLAYQYSLNGTLAGIGLGAAWTIINDASFGVSAQTLQPLATLQAGVARLG